MTDDLEYLQNYKTDHLYTVPARNNRGAYATLVGDSEHVLGEMDVTSLCKIAVSAFFVQGRADFDTLKITKLTYHQRFGWRKTESIQVNGFQAAQMREFVALISNLDMRDAKKTRISLNDNVDVSTLGALLATSRGASLIRELASNPELHHDIYAVAAKRSAVSEFERNLAGDLSERDWQAFFEQNSWIFGHGLNYIFLNKVSGKLETQTTGSAFDRPGKRADGLLRTRAEVSQYVLVEIKRNDTQLLQETAYRSGCWGVSDELSNAVTQAQKIVFDFTRDRFRDHLKDQFGNDTGVSVYAVEPRSFLVIGDLTQVLGNDDKVACFELYRRNIRAPEILTFDELFQRASCIVENISRERSSVSPTTDASDAGNGRSVVRCDRNPIPMMPALFARKASDADACKSQSMASGDL